MNPRECLRLRLLPVIAFACLSTVCQAAEGLTPEEAVEIAVVQEPAFSPDGAKLAYVVRAFQGAETKTSHLWLLEALDAAPHPIAASDKSEWSPQWSPDGGTLAFLSNRNGSAQVYMLKIGGADPVALTSSKSGVQSFHWAPDGRRIAYLAKEDAAAAPGRGPKLAGQERDLARLWVIDLASKESRRLTQGAFRIDDFQWRNGSELLAAASDRPWADEFTGAVYRVSIDKGAFEPVSQPPQPFANLVVSPDGGQFAVSSTRTGGPLPHDLFLGAVADGRLRDATASLGRRVAEAKWIDRSTLWVRVIDGFYSRLYRLASDAAPERVDLPLSVHAFDVSRQGVVAFVGADFDHLPELYLRMKDGSIRQIGHAQQAEPGVPRGPVRIFQTRSFDGRQIEAALMTPTRPDPKARSPLVLLVHGGPASNFSADAADYAWEYSWAQLLVAHGYEVLLVNPRGSDGYGEDFLKANRGDWGGGDFKDLMAVLDAVIAEGRTDPDRLAIGGWSYGGEMSAWAPTQTRRFKAAVVGAGVFDQAAEFETEESDGAAGDAWYFGTPWEHPEVFVRNSPSTQIRNARTPTLILHGENDVNNPVGQAQGLYRALRHFGVEAQLAIYPGEGHSPRRRTDELDMLARILAWYEAHLAPSPPAA